ncbi:MAG: MYXO-CTERM sorting domain-containing protein [Myxococcota bacterium]
MIALYLLASFASADRAGNDAPQECRFDFVGVVPTFGSAAVPTDTLVRVLPQGEACGEDEIALVVTEAGVVQPELSIRGVSGSWAEFPSVELKAETTYRLEFRTFNNELIVDFTTGVAPSVAPLPPAFRIDSIGAVETEGQIGVFMDAQFTADVKDPSGNSTLRLFLDDRFDRHFGTAEGKKVNAVLWVEQTVPSEVCISAVTVGPNGNESEPTVDCAEPTYTFLDDPIGGNSGCNCSSSGGSAWWLLGLAPVVLLGRRRR